MPDETQTGNNVAREAKTVEGSYDRIKSVEAAHQALLSRKRIPLLLQIYLAFFIIFVFAAGVGITIVMTNFRIEKKIRFLEIANEFTLEIVQARRFEKNFFLYGTSLNDAVENAYQARLILKRNEGELRKILGNTHGVILSSMDQYLKLLERLATLQEKKTINTEKATAKKEIELALREHGRELVSIAQDLKQEERKAVFNILSRSRSVQIYSLILLVFLLGVIAFLISTRFLGNINRFAGYAKRIASGDFTPITPAKGYRDEFTEVAIAINQMILELENREAVLVQSHKMRAVGTLTAGVAHELNNPLNNITLTAHMLLEDYHDLGDEERKEMVNDVISESERSKKIISNLLDFARESSSLVESLDMARLLRDTIILASNQLKLSGIKIEFQSTENLPRVHGDAQQLEQVFLNLILNAVDASSKGGKIQVLVLPADDPSYVAVKVIDTGAGIPAHILPSIFDPFFTTKAKGKGTGLGLSVSQGIIEKHGGRIRVASKEGQGTTFTVTLPITTIPAQITV